MSPSKLYIITAALSCQGGSQNWQNCPRTNAQLTKDFPPKKLNIDHQIKYSCYSENHEILVYESNRLFSKLPVIKNIMKIYVLEDQADTLRQKQMTTSTHWARWWRWWACCRWTWSCSRSSQGASHPSCRGPCPSWICGRDQSWQLFPNTFNVNLYALLEIERKMLISWGSSFSLPEQN